MKYIDLTVVLNEQTPTYEGDPQTKVVPGAKVATDLYADSYLSVYTHTGTHVDAPSHMVENGKTLDQFPVDHFVGRGRLIDATDKQITLAKVQAAAIGQGDIVLFWTGMSDQYKGSAYYHDYPTIPEDVAHYLVAQKVKMVGVDMCSVDGEPFKVHKILLPGDVLIIENLTNLKALQGKDFTVFALPINVQVDGAPARVIAQIDD